jgi:RNA recognition motif-containing protein
MNLHITNLNANTIERDLLKMFSRYGEVGTVQVVRDKLNNRSRGRAFVEMPSSVDATKAITGLHRSDHGGKLISVVEIGYNPSPDAWTFLTNDIKSGQNDFITGDKGSLL